MRELMLVGDVAKTLGVSAEWVRRLVERGQLKTVGTTVRGVVVFSKEEAERVARDRGKRAA